MEKKGQVTIGTNGKKVVIAGGVGSENAGEVSPEKTSTTFETPDLLSLMDDTWLPKDKSIGQKVNPIIAERAKKIQEENEKSRDNLKDLIESGALESMMPTTRLPMEFPTDLLITLQNDTPPGGKKKV